MEETRIALVGIIVENPDNTADLNRILHDYADYVIGRMGIPYREKKINIISIAIDAPQDAISTLSQVFRYSYISCIPSLIAQPDFFQQYLQSTQGEMMERYASTILYSPGNCSRKCFNKLAVSPFFRGEPLKINVFIIWITPRIHLLNDTSVKIAFINLLPLIANDFITLKPGKLTLHLAIIGITVILIMLRSAKRLIKRHQQQGLF